MNAVIANEEVVDGVVAHWENDVHGMDYSEWTDGALEGDAMIVIQKNKSLMDALVTTPGYTQNTAWDILRATAKRSVVAYRYPLRKRSR